MQSLRSVQESSSVHTESGAAGVAHKSSEEPLRKRSVTIRIIITPNRQVLTPGKASCSCFSKPEFLFILTSAWKIAMFSPPPASSWRLWRWISRAVASQDRGAHTQVMPSSHCFKQHCNDVQNGIAASWKWRSFEAVHRICSEYIQNKGH